MFTPCIHKEVTITVPGAISMSQPNLNGHLVRIFAEWDTIIVQDLPSKYTFDMEVIDNLSYQPPGLMRSSNE